MGQANKMRAFKEKLKLERSKRIKAAAGVVVGFFVGLLFGWAIIALTASFRAYSANKWPWQK